MSKPKRLSGSIKPTLASIERMVAGLTLELKTVPKTKCRPAAYAIQAKQTSTYQFLATTGLGDRPLLLGRRISGGDIQILLGCYFLELARPEESVSVLTADIPDDLAIQIAIVIGKAAYQTDNLTLAKAYAGAVDTFNISARELARVIGVSYPSVSTRLQMLDMPEYVKNKVATGAISFRNARALLQLSPKAMEEAALNLAVKGKTISETLPAKGRKPAGSAVDSGWSLAKPEQPTSPRAAAAENSTYIKQLNAALSEAVGTPVTVTESAAGGTIEMKFHNAEAGAGILELLSSKRGTVNIGGVIRIEIPSKTAMDGFVTSIIPSEDDY